MELQYQIIHEKLLQDAGYEVIDMDQFRPRANYAIFKKPGNANPVVYKVVEIPLPRDEENKLKACSQSKYPI